MKRIFLKYLALVLALLTLISVVACAKPTPSPPLPPPAEFEVVSLNVTPLEVMAGETVSITAEIENIGGSEGTYAVTLTIDGVETETKNVTLAPETTKAVTFSLVKDQAGSYEIAIGTLRSSLTVKEKLTALEQLKVAYPELFEELLKLPDLEEIDEKNNEAIEDITRLASDPECEAAFESMLNEGIKDKRKYCAPLEALLWIAYDREFDGDNPLQDYSLKKLMDDAWKNATTSKNYTSEKWQDFDEVVDRLNSPRLVSIYMINNIAYDYEEAKNVPHRFAPPRDTFLRRKGICNEQARFALYCLLNNGYDYDNFEAKDNAVCMLGIDIDILRGHDVCLFREKSLFYTIDNGRIRGAFPSVEAASDSTAVRVNIAPWNKYFFRDTGLRVTKVVRAEEIERITIDRIVDEWPSDTAMVSDLAGDVSSDAKDKRGVDLKAVRAFIDEDYLYVAIQIYDVFESSLLRNYFIALDFDNDGRDEYQFGVRPNGDTWVFDHTRDKNNWNAEDAWGVFVVGARDTIEVRIPKKEYGIPSNIWIYCRVTEGGPTVDQTEWFQVS